MISKHRVTYNSFKTTKTKILFKTKVKRLCDCLRFLGCWGIRSFGESGHVAQIDRANKSESKIDYWQQSGVVQICPER